MTAKDASGPSGRMREHHPAALTVAGSDSGGGAGIQADIRAFNYFGVFPTTAVSALTAQVPSAVHGVFPASPQILEDQIRVVLDELDVRALKTGMLFNTENIQTVYRVLRHNPLSVTVVDPVMVSTSGARLLEEDAQQTLADYLLPLATVITPNIPEAKVLAGCDRLEDANPLKLGRQLRDRFGCNVLVKGGHRRENTVTDVLIHQDTRVRSWLFEAPRIEAPTTHGTGCAFSAALTACLALNEELTVAIQKAKTYVQQSLENCVRIGPQAFALTPPAKLDPGRINCRQV